MSLEDKVKNYLNDINPWRTINIEQIVDYISREDEKCEYTHVEEIIEKLIESGEVIRELNGYIHLNKNPSIEEQDDIYNHLISSLKYIGYLSVDTLFIVPLHELITRTNKKHPKLRINKIDVVPCGNGMLHYRLFIPFGAWNSPKFCKEIIRVDYTILKLKSKIQYLLDNKEEFLLDLVKRNKDVFEYIHEPELLGNAVELFQVVEKPFNFDEKIEETSLIACSICQSNKIKVVFRCGHTTCFSCSGRLVKCPTCRTNIKKRIRVFL
jgi:hypothetical protein